MATKRKFLSLREKVDVITRAETHKLSVRTLADEFGVGKTQISSILQHKDELLTEWREHGNEERKTKFPKSQGLAVDTVVFKWFVAARNKNIPISGPIIQG